jgi:hypothetical protein
VPETIANNQNACRLRRGARQGCVALALPGLRPPLTRVGFAVAGR